MRFAALPALILLACQPAEPIADNQAAGDVNTTRAAPGQDAVVSSDDPTPQQPSRDGPTADCPIMASSGWQATVDASSRLTVRGRVTVPTGGYLIEWGDMRVAESYPVQIFADLRVVPPSGPATQAVTTHDVRGDWPMDQPVGSFTVRCGNRVLARVSPVETAR